MAWHSNYSYWQSNPNRIIPISHSVWDPNFSLLSSDTYSAGFTDVSSIALASGLHHWLYTVGIGSETDLYLTSVSLEIISVVLVVIGYLHSLLVEIGFLNSLDTATIEIAYITSGYRLNSTHAWMYSALRTQYFKLYRRIQVSYI